MNILYFSAACYITRRNGSVKWGELLNDAIWYNCIKHPKKIGVYILISAVNPKHEWEEELVIKCEWNYERTAQEFFLVFARFVVLLCMTE